MQDSIKKNYKLVDCFNTIFANNTLQIPRLFAYDEVDSTNNVAKLYAEGNGSSDTGAALFFTRTQRAGRGTRMRTFESPRDSGLYMSLIIRPKEDVVFATRITMLTAVAVCRVINRLIYGNEAKIKWVNDITISDKKLAGILTESALDVSGKTRYIIIGIGVNLKPGGHSPEVEKIMTSLLEYGIDISAEKLSALITKELLLELERGGYDFIDEYREMSSILGRRVTVTDFNGAYSATALSIADDGALIVKRDNGEETTLISADVSVRPL